MILVLAIVLLLAVFGHIVYTGTVVVGLRELVRGARNGEYRSSHGRIRARDLSPSARRSIYAMYLVWIGLVLLVVALAVARYA